jgi:hypothetical protein
MNVFYILLSIAGGVVLGWWLRSRRTGDPIRKHPRGMEEADPYRLCERVFTTPEAAFLESLQSVLPQGFHVLSKVRLSEVLNVSYGAADRSEAHSRVNGKRLDFVVCDAAHLPVLAVLLGEAEDRRTREFIERVCAKVGLPVERVAAQPAYSEMHLRSLTERMGEKVAARPSGAGMTASALARA